MGISLATPAEVQGKPALLNSWKEIAVYLNRGVRTVQRWHFELELPVHKVRATARSPVFAYKAEIDQWLRRRALQDDDDLHPVQEDRARVSCAAERAMRSTSKMSLLVDQQRDQLIRLAAQVNRLAQLQKSR